MVDVKDKDVDIVTDSIVSNFIRGLKKSFSGKSYLRELNECKLCGKPSFTNICLYCKTQQDYEESEKKDKRN